MQYYILTILVRLLGYPYLSFRLLSFSPRWLHRAFDALLWAELIASTLVMLLQIWIIHPVLDVMMRGFFAIFFSLIYTLGFVVLADLVGTFALPRLAPALSHGARRRLQWATALLAFTLFASSMWIGYHSVADVEVNRYSLRLERLLEEGEEPQHHLRLALLTDVHIGAGIPLWMTRQAVKRTLAERPDLVLIGGDFIDAKSEYAYAPEAQEVMRRLSSVPLGAYYVLGNHEYRVDTLANMAYPAKVGGVLLLDSVASLGAERIQLVGRDDYINESRASLGELMARADTLSPVILLEHTPLELDSLEGKPIDLALYGHTHGGQLTPMQVLMVLRYGIAWGAKDYGRTRVHVSQGVGAAKTPYRLGTRSEIVVYDLYW